MMPNLQRISAKEPEEWGTSSSSHFASLCEERTSPHSRIVSRVLAIRIKRNHEKHRSRKWRQTNSTPPRSVQEADSRSVVAAVAGGCRQESQCLPELAASLRAGRDVVGYSQALELGKNLKRPFTQIDERADSIEKGELHWQVMGPPVIYKTLETAEFVSGHAAMGDLALEYVVHKIELIQVQLPERALKRGHISIGQRTNRLRHRFGSLTQDVHVDAPTLTSASAWFNGLGDRNSVQRSRVAILMPSHVQHRGFLLGREADSRQAGPVSLASAR